MAISDIFSGLLWINTLNSLPFRHPLHPIQYSLLIPNKILNSSEKRSTYRQQEPWFRLPSDNESQKTTHLYETRNSDVYFVEYNKIQANIIYVCWGEILQVAQRWQKKCMQH